MCAPRGACGRAGCVFHADAQLVLEGRHHFVLEWYRVARSPAERPCGCHRSSAHPRTLPNSENPLCPEISSAADSDRRWPTAFECRPSRGCRASMLRIGVLQFSVTQTSANFQIPVTHALSQGHFSIDGLNVNPEPCGGVWFNVR
jgi:hypothetical protein